MSGVYPWLYVDHTNNIWKFSLSDNKELRYNIMYTEGKWTKESLIDTGVLGFAVHIDDSERMHIVYSNIKGELKYCTMRNKQWVGKTLYHMESDEFEIQNLRVEIIEEDMHIFYMLIANDGSDHGVLMHCRWNGKEATVDTVQDIILQPKVQVYYVIIVSNGNELDLFFINDEGDEASLQYCRFQKERWTAAKRLYGIQGDSICVEVLSDEQEIHILNRYREDSTYLLDYVCIDAGGNVRDFRVCESRGKIEEPLLFVEGNSLYSCWLEQDKIFYSIFDGEKWCMPICFNGYDVSTLKRYNCLISDDEENSIKARGIYGTVEPDLYLFVPNHFIKEMKDSLNYEDHKADSNLPNKTEELQSIRVELRRLKAGNKNSEKKIASLNMQLQKKERSMEEYKETIAKILDQKRKVEENFNICLEVQQNNQKGLEQTKKQLSEEIMLTVDLKKKLKEWEQENEELQMQVKKIRGEKELLQKQVEQQKEENMKLQEELQFEKNQSIMERLLRRRFSEV